VGVDDPGNDESAREVDHTVNHATETRRLALRKNQGVGAWAESSNMPTGTGVMRNAPVSPANWR
jgi:hypothetical protein